MRLDCRSLEYQYFPFNPKGYKLVLLDTVVKHELASSAYNKRRESCENVARAIGVKFLRDASIPGTVHVFFRDALDAKGFFKPVSELKALYESVGATPDKEIIFQEILGEIIKFRSQVDF